MTVITERQEELLSYLTGLAPVGIEFFCRRSDAVKDLGLRLPDYFSKDIRSLSIAKAIRLIAGGVENRNKPVLLVVLKRPEQFKVVSAPNRQPARSSRHDVYDARAAA